VSLGEFQRALADMVASPAFARAVLRGERARLDDYELTTRERSRLEVVAAQPGMEVNCTLYRSNRLTPIVMLLPYTCFVLADRLKWIAQRFWDEQSTDLQFQSEVERFAAYLRGLVTSGEVNEPLLDEILAFELATNELRFLPRRRLGEDAARATGQGLRMHPLVRLVRFRHEPRKLLELLAAAERPPYALEEGEFAALLVAGQEELDVRVIDQRFALILETLADGSLSLDEEDAQVLIDQGLAVRA
jgi:hypothetical protein